jgi:hypothetical protein
MENTGAKEEGKGEEVEGGGRRSRRGLPVSAMEPSRRADA